MYEPSTPSLDAKGMAYLLPRGMRGFYVKSYLGVDIAVEQVDWCCVLEEGEAVEGTQSERECVGKDVLTFD
jgi:hypothetical protein